jgi:hypothetical protein
MSPDSNDPWSNRWLPTLRFLVASDEAIPGYSGMVYEGLSATRKDGGWFLVVRATARGGEHVVTFYAGRRLYEALWHFAYDLTHGSVKWSKDRYKE